MFQDKTILITGGTGSFGNAFVEKILTSHKGVKKIIIYSRDEYKQFQMAQKEIIKNNISKIRFFIGDVRDEERLQMAFHNVDIVIHAAALKQIVAAEYNPFEFIKTNVLGAQNIISAALKNKVKTIVALSTDKACSPINLYGATKLCSDKLFIAANSYVSDLKTTFSVVRYGNVSASRGSVIPFFKDLIDSNVKEIPITHSDMTRFWLTLDQSVEMVIDCVEKSLGGELFVKKIPSLKITELAKIMAPHLPQKIVGIRPGEKIYESMINKEDSLNVIENDKYYIILPVLDFISRSEYLRYHNATENKIPFEYNSENNVMINNQEVIDFLKKHKYL